MKINTVHKIAKYRYIGFGAPHMEDFKLVHSVFSIKDLICLEYDNKVHARQKFNTPLKCITFLNQSSGNYITNYEVGKNSIIWLDYASPQDLGQQVQEFQQLLLKTIEYDVVKITLNANPNCLFDKGQEQNPIIREQKRLDKLTERLGIYLPPDTQPSMMSTKMLPKVLLKSLKIAIDAVIPPVFDLTFVPLSSFTYNDKPHQMVTLTGIILKKGNKTKFLKDSLLRNWEYYIGNSLEPISINMPDLTLRERLAIDTLLPNSKPSTIQKKLKVLLDDNEAKSLNKIESYKRFYRHYPHFSRINM